MGKTSREPSIKVSIITILLLPVIFFVGGLLTYYAKPSMLEAEYGEVPFKLTFEVDGEKRIIEDTIICEFNGYGKSGANGTYRKWNTSLKSGKKDIVLLNVRSENELVWERYPILELYFQYGNAAYYMDREYGAVQEPQSLEEIYFTYQEEEKIGTSVMTADEAWERFKLRLISWEELPIQTTVDD